MKIDLDLDDLTNTALKRLVKKLLVAGEDEERSILQELEQTSMAEKESNDLADLTEEKRGKPSSVSLDEEPPKKKGK